MEQVFINLLNTSITAGYLVLAVLLLRPLLKKAPKFIRCILWGLVGLRLVLPFSPESVTSMIPNSQPIPPEIVTSQKPVIQSGFSALNSVVNPILSESMAPTAGSSITPMQVFMGIAWKVWVLGVLLLAVYSLVSFLVLRLRLREAVREDGNVWLCDRVSSPFLLGLLRPRIYLPSDLEAGDRTYVLAHENAHIRRKDHWWKPLGFLLLTVYWFNPLMWVAYIFLCRDIEFACDEKVIRELGETEKKPYSQALINCSVSKKMISACPVAFGEDGVKGRIQSVLNYKKPAFWIVLIAILACIAVAVCFLTNPPQDKPDTTEYRFQAKVVEIREDSLLVEPIDGETYFSGAAQVVVNLNDSDPSDYRLGCTVDIIYDGMVQELYPPIIPNATSIVNKDIWSSTIPDPDYSFQATVTEIHDDHIIVKYRTLPWHNLDYRFYRVNTDPTGISVGATVEISYNGKVTDAEPYPILGETYWVEVLSESIVNMDSMSSTIVQPKPDYSFVATVDELCRDHIIVKCQLSLPDNLSYSYFRIDTEPAEFSVGDMVTVSYEGVLYTIRSPYPVLQGVYSIRVINPAKTTEKPEADNVFSATVLEVRDDFLLVKPYADEYERTVSAQLLVSTKQSELYGFPNAVFAIGEQISVRHDGTISEGQPPVIANVISISHLAAFDFELSETVSTPDHAAFDIDNDGYIEDCYVKRDPMTGSCHFIVYAYQNGVLEYCNRYWIDTECRFFFSGTESYMFIAAVDYYSGETIDTYSISVESFNLVLKNSKGKIDYSDKPAPILPTLHTMEEKYPQYIRLDASQGLELWVLYDGSTYSCQLYSIANIILQDFTASERTSLEEMAVILSTYQIPKEQISIEFSSHTDNEADALTEGEKEYARQVLFTFLPKEVTGEIYMPPEFDAQKTYPVVVFAYQLGENSWRFSFHDNTSITKATEDAMFGFHGLDFENAKKKLSEYDLPPSEIPVIVINSYISSYLYEITEETTQEARRVLGLL